MNSDDQARAVAVPMAAISAAMISAVQSVVPQARGEQRCVAAADAGSHSGVGRVVQVAVAATHDEAGGEEKRGRDRPEADACHRADPAAVHREHEEEDDAQKRDDAACPGEHLRGEEVREGEPAPPRRLLRRRRRSRWEQALGWCARCPSHGRRRRGGRSRLAHDWRRRDDGRRRNDRRGSDGRRRCNSDGLLGVGRNSAAQVCKLALEGAEAAREVLDRFPQIVRGPMLRARRMRVPVRHGYRSPFNRGRRPRARDHLDYEEEWRHEGLQPPEEGLLPDGAEVVLGPHHPHRVGDPERHRTQGPDDAGDAAADLGEDFRQEEKPEQAEPVVEDQGNGEIAVRSATTLSHRRPPSRRRSGRRRARPRPRPPGRP
jgi:hypothetical protein